MRRKLRHRCVRGLMLSVLLLATVSPCVADDYLDQDLNGDDQPYDVLSPHEFGANMVDPQAEFALRAGVDKFSASLRWYAGLVFNSRDSEKGADFLNSLSQGLIAERLSQFRADFDELAAAVKRAEGRGESSEEKSSEDDPGLQGNTRLDLPSAAEFKSGAARQTAGLVGSMGEDAKLGSAPGRDLVAYEKAVELIAVAKGRADRLAIDADLVNRAYATGGALRRTAGSLAREYVKGIRDKGISLRKTFSGPGAAQGANFTLNRNLEEGESKITSQFALTWAPFGRDARKFIGAKKRGRIGLQPYLSLAGDLTSGKASKEKGFTGRFGAHLVLDRSPKIGGRINRKTSQLWMSASGKFYRSQDNHIRYWAGELVIAPKHGPWALGVRRGHETIRYDAATKTWDGINPENGCCCPGTNLISWQWDADVQGQFGRLKRNHRNEKKVDGKDMHHLGVRLSGRVYLDGLARDVLQRGWNSTLYPYIELGGGVFYAKYRSGRQREYVRALLKFPLNTLIGIDLTYHNGAKGEVLDHEESLVLSLDVRI